jgi:DNA-directed RNA polymerase subunit RPC12/RpoP
MITKFDEFINESLAYICSVCGERAEHEEIEKNPKLRCSNCGHREWDIEHDENYEHMDEGFTRDIKGFINPTADDIISKANNKINELSFSLRRARNGNINYYVVYIDDCNFILNSIKKVEKKMNNIGVKLSPTLIEPVIHEIKKKKDIRDKEGIRNWIDKALNAIVGSWPTDIKTSEESSSFTKEINKVRNDYNALADKYNTPKIK